METYLLGCDVLGADIPLAGAVYTDSKTVTMVQAALRDKGFDPGPIDGTMGPKTSAAIKKMQKALGAGQSGVIDEGVISALNVIPAAKPTLPQQPTESVSRTPAAPAGLVPIGPSAPEGLPPGPGAVAAKTERPVWQYALAGVGGVAVLAGLVTAVVRR